MLRAAAKLIEAEPADDLGVGGVQGRGEELRPGIGGTEHGGDREEGEPKAAHDGPP